MGDIGDGRRSSVYDQRVQTVYVAVETHPRAIYALVAAVAAWVTCPFVGALVALSFAREAERNIDESNGQYGGRGLLSAARGLAWVNLAWSGVMLLFLLATVAAAP